MIVPWKGSVKNWQSGSKKSKVKNQKDPGKPFLLWIFDF